jgi:NAD(P)-dependent dehydrogenase (short-subunit alcohol dehydrogenase family)
MSKAHAQTHRSSPGRIAPVLRGFLARNTGNEDFPWCAPILKSFPEEMAPAFGAGGGLAQRAGADAPPAMMTAPPEGPQTDEELREGLGSCLKEYESRHGRKPEVVCIPEVGVFRAERPQSMGRLSGRVVVVTGAAGAIGYGICQSLLDEGCHLAVTDLAGAKLDQFAAEFSKRWPERVIAVPMDVTSAESVSAAFTQISAAWGGVDAVVLNAGIALACPLVELDLEAFRRLERVNVEGTLLSLAEAGRHFARQRLGGDIVLVSTKNVFSPGAGFGAYSATKAAAHQLARIASLEFASMGVRVNMVAPDAVFSGGAYRSGLWSEVGPGRMKARGLDEKGLEEYYQNRNLLKAKVTAQHVANAVLYFLLRQTPTTGACIPVDGGLPDATPR